MDYSNDVSESRESEADNNSQASEKDGNSKQSEADSTNGVVEGDGDTEECEEDKHSKSSEDDDNSESSEMDCDNDILNYKQLFYDSILCNSPIGMKLYLDRLTVDQRKRIVEQKLHESVFKSLGLFDEVDVDIFFDEEEIETLRVRPLLLAVYNSSYSAAKMLLAEGANVNATSCYRNARTAIILACRCNDPDMVDLLIEHGADATGDIGAQCLYSCILNADLCSAEKLMSLARADPNEICSLKMPLLQTAIEEGLASMIGLLIDNGADVFQRDSRNEDSLVFACRDGKREIVELLINKTGLEVRERIDAYQLLGCSYALESAHPDTASCLSVWSVALKLLIDNELMNAVQYLPPKPVYGNAEEPRSLQDLEGLVSSRDGIYMYALMLQERILGEDSYSASWCRQLCAYNYLKMSNYQRTMEITLHELMIYTGSRSSSLAERIKNEKFPNEICDDSDNWNADMEALRDVQDQQSLEEVVLEPEVIDRAIESCLNVLEWLYGEIRSSFDIVDNFGENLHYAQLSPDPRDTARLKKFVDEYRRLLMRYVIDMIVFVVRFDKRMISRTRLRSVICRIQETLKRETTTLLHETARSKIGSGFGFRECVANILIQCGSRANATDENGDEPLRVLAENLADLYKGEPRKLSEFNKRSDQNLYRCTIIDILLCGRLLLRNGAHCDIKGGDGKTAMDRFGKLGLNFLGVSSVPTLQCLVAKFLHRINYPMEMVPPCLQTYVQQH